MSGDVHIESDGPRIGARSVMGAEVGLADVDGRVPGLSEESGKGRFGSIESVDIPVGCRDHWMSTRGVGVAVQRPVGDV